MSGFFCQECGHAFRTVKAAQKASFGDAGCPKCGGSDIDLGKPGNHETDESGAAGYARITAATAARRDDA